MAALDLKKIVRDAHPEWQKDAIQRLYVIRNGRVGAQTRQTHRTLGSISANSITTMLKVSGDTCRQAIAMKLPTCR